MRHDTPSPGESHTVFFFQVSISIHKKQGTILLHKPVICNYVEYYSQSIVWQLFDIIRVVIFTAPLFAFGHTFPPLLWWCNFKIAYFYLYNIAHFYLPRYISLINKFGVISHMACLKHNQPLQEMFCALSSRLRFVALLVWYWSLVLLYNTISAYKISLLPVELPGLLFLDCIMLQTVFRQP